MQGLSKLGSGNNVDGVNWAFEPQTYSPEVQAYLAKVEARARELGPDYYSALYPTGEMNNGDVSLPTYATDALLRQYIDKPVDEQIGYAFSPDGKWGTTGVVSAGPGTKVVLMDDKTGEIVYQGTGFEGAQEAQRRVAAMGGKAPWSIYEAPEGTEDYYRWAQNEPQQGFVSGMGQLIATVGPVVAGGAMAAGSGVLGTTATAGVGLGTQAGVQAGIAGLGGAMQGKSISKIAFDAAKAAGMTWAAGEYGDDLMRSVGLTPTGPGPGIGDAAGVAAGGGAGSADEIVINGIKDLTGAAVGGGLTGLDDPGITVTAKPPVTIPTVPVSGIGDAPLDDPGITITGKKPEDITIPTVPVTIPDTGNLPFNPGPIDTSVKTPDVTEDDKKWYEKLGLSDWARLLQAGVAIGGGLLGDSGDDGPPAGTGTNSPPVDYDAAVASGARTQRPATFNPFTYGQPQGDQPGQFQFFEKKPVAAAEGGEPSLLERAAQEYPFLKRYNPVVVQGIGEGESETWRPKEPGDKAHPRPPTIPIDRLGFEFYGEPTNQGLAGEAMHVDRKANHVREKLRDTMTPEQIERLKQESGDYKMSVERGMPEDAAIKNALDGAVRGYVIGQWPADANERMGYTEKQRKELDKLKRYVTGAKDHAEGGGIGEMEEHAAAYAQGGGHQGTGPVAGIGGGQEDKIPAWLSDGEYVWSAQDVSDLGDGSTNEGVRRLDKMRQQVRRQAGRKDVKKIAKPQAGIGDLMAGAV